MNILDNSLNEILKYKNLYDLLKSFKPEKIEYNFFEDSILFAFSKRDKQFRIIKHYEIDLITVCLAIAKENNITSGNFKHIKRSKLKKEIKNILQDKNIYVV